VHRYKDFNELHEKLQKETALSKDLLPGKKLLKNREFLETRQRDLEKYLKIVAKTVQHQVPLEFVEFLDFHKYDSVFLLQKLAVDLSQRTEKKWTFTILQVCGEKTEKR
jgi:nischarin